VEGFHKYIKIRPYGHLENRGIFDDKEDKIIIQEKIDGANFRFVVHRGKVIFGSRCQQLTSDEGEEDNVSKNFKRCVDFVREKIESKDKKFLKTIEGLIFFGETCVRHTMAYNWETIPPFLGFDILDKDKFLDYEIVKTVFETLNLEMVPLIYNGFIKGTPEINQNNVPISKYAPLSSPKQLAEGFVIKNYDKQLFAKIVLDTFKEENAIAFGGSPKYNKDQHNDNDVIVFKYCTNARIEKIIFKLIDDGGILEMALMKELPTRVHKDITDEEWISIVNSKWVVDFGRLKKLITKRCLAVLKQVININKE